MLSLSITFSKPTPTSFSQLVCRSFDSNMDKLAKAIYSFLNHIEINIPFAIKELNYMAFLAYYDKRHLGKDVNQFSMHCDQRWTASGKFMYNVNTQDIDTATCVLTVGDTRNVSFQCYMETNSGGKKGIIELNEKEFSSHTFKLTHGSLFILHPRDEKTFLRTYFDEWQGTFFKHGDVYFRKDGISVELVFRTSSKSAVVNT